MLGLLFNIIITHLSTGAVFFFLKSVAVLFILWFYEQVMST